MNCSLLLPVLIGVLFLGAMPGRANDQRQAQLEDLCRQPNGQKARPPKKRGLYLGRALFRPADITGADIGVDRYTDDPIVIVNFSSGAARRFGALTAKNVGQTLPIFLNGKLLSCPVINEPISGGEVQISGGLSQTEVEDIASAIKRYAG